MEMIKTPRGVEACVELVNSAKEKEPVVRAPCPPIPGRPQVILTATQLRYLRAFQRTGFVSEVKREVGDTGSSVQSAINRAVAQNGGSDFHDRDALCRNAKELGLFDEGMGEIIADAAQRLRRSHP